MSIFTAVSGDALAAIHDIAMRDGEAAVSPNEQHAAATVADLCAIAGIAPTSEYVGDLAVLYSNGFRVGARTAQAEQDRVLAELRLLLAGNPWDAR
jgi:hypothetical protein